MVFTVELHVIKVFTGKRTFCCPAVRRPQRNLNLYRKPKPFPRNLPNPKRRNPSLRKNPSPSPKKRKNLRNRMMRKKRHFRMKRIQRKSWMMRRNHNGVFGCR